MAAAAAVPLALFVAGTAISAYSAYEQGQIANQSADLQREQIREQQVQLRIQENQSSIERLKNLRRITAANEVLLGTRNISQGSGTANAIINQSYTDFQADETASKLNFMAKNVSLDTQRQGVELERQSRMMSAGTGFLTNEISLYNAVNLIPSSAAVKSTTPKNPFTINRNT